MPVFFFIIAHESSALVESIISPMILNVWALHISDPFISIDALEVLEVMILFYFVSEYYYLLSSFLIYVSIFY